MNLALVTGTVVSSPDEPTEHGGSLVTNFRLAIDGHRRGKPQTEVIVSAWNENARFARQYVTAGDRVAVFGSLSHAAGKGVLVTASHIARLGEELFDATLPDSKEARA
jgi:single-stranded DNA-binding protein